MRRDSVAFLTRRRVHRMKSSRMETAPSRRKEKRRRETGNTVFSRERPPKWWEKVTITKPERALCSKKEVWAFMWDLELNRTCFCGTPGKSHPACGACIPRFLSTQDSVRKRFNAKKVPWDFDIEKYFVNFYVPYQKLRAYQRYVTSRQKRAMVYMQAVEQNAAAYRSTVKGNRGRRR